MAIKKWLDYGRELWLESQQAWEWLRNLPQYRADYRVMKRHPQQPHEILPGTTILSAPSQTPDQFVESMKKKWGFYPLINPIKRSINSEFFKHLLKLLNLENTEAGVKNEMFNYAHIVKSIGKDGRYIFYAQKDLPPLPERITFKINPQFPITPAMEYIGEFLKDVQHAYKIRRRQPGAVWLCSKYKAYVLRQLGVPERDIKPLLTQPASNPNAVDSERQRRARIMKGAKKAFM